VFEALFYFISAQQSDDKVTMIYETWYIGPFEAASMRVICQVNI